MNILTLNGKPININGKSFLYDVRNISGGEISYYDDYIIHIFNSSGTFQVAELGNGLFY